VDQKRVTRIEKNITPEEKAALQYWFTREELKKDVNNFEGGLKYGACMGCANKPKRGSNPKIGVLQNKNKCRSGRVCTGLKNTKIIERLEGRGKKETLDWVFIVGGQWTGSSSGVINWKQTGMRRIPEKGLRLKPVKVAKEGQKNETGKGSPLRILRGIKRILLRQME